MEIRYALVKELPETDYDEAVARATEYLADEGFGVLTEIDVKATLKKKIDVDFKRYVILGACNPSLANRAISIRPEIGLFLPCNITVEEVAEGECLVRIINPQTMMSMGDMGEELSEVAEEATDRLQKVAEALRQIAQ